MTLPLKKPKQPDIMHGLGSVITPGRRRGIMEDRLMVSCKTLKRLTVSQQQAFKEAHESLTPDLHHIHVCSGTAAVRQFSVRQLTPDVF